jgi:ribosomal protein S18 acetylase RimI-like enzyme
MFRQIKIDLGNEYSINAIKEEIDIAVEIRKNQELIGKARMVTDNVDVSCITAIQIDDEHVNNKFNDQFTLGEIVLKLLIKFPSIVREPEFRFILDVPDNLKETISKYHFDRGEDSDLKNEILIRKDNMFPEKQKAPDNISFKQSIEDENLPVLLSLLRNNAYWQTHLTLDRLKLLINNSRCFFAISDGQEIIGFSRVLTNNNTFASLWDVVVDERYRGKGIGIGLMFKIFTDEALSNIDNWILFTDTAKGLYQKFGFVPEGEISTRKLVHKLRLQESHPAYMSELIRAISNEKPIHLNIDQTLNFLFGE